MTELYTRQDLLEEPPGPVLCQLAMLDNVVKELSSGDIFHDHEDVGRSGNDLVQLDYVRVAEQLQVLDLPANLSNHVQGLDLLPIQNFHSNLVSGHLMKGN